MKKYYIALILSLIIFGVSIGMAVYTQYTENKNSHEEPMYEALEVSDIILEDPPAEVQDSDTNQKEPEKEVSEKDEEILPVSKEEQAEFVEKEIPAFSYSGERFKQDGIWVDDRFTYTWYSSRVLVHYRINEWKVNSEGIYEDAEGYVVVASSDYSEGTVITNTLFGDVKVYDHGCPSGVLDVYVNF